MTVPGGLDKQIQFNNAGAFGGTAGFEYQNAVDPRLSLTPSVGLTALYIKDPTATTPPSFVLSSPALIQCSLTDGSTYWAIAYTNDQAPNNWGSFVNDSGDLQFSNVTTADVINSRVSFAADGSITIESIIVPAGPTSIGFTGISASASIPFNIGSVVEANHNVSFANIPSGGGGTTFLNIPHSLALSSINGGGGTPGGIAISTDGPIAMATGGTALANERLRIDTAGLVGINKASSIGAQTHIVSGAAARVGLIVDSAASASVDIAQFRNNASAAVQFAVKQDGMFTYPGNTTNAAQFDKTSDAAFATVTGLSVPVRAGRTYVFRAVLEITCGAVGGFQIRINGTATATSVQWTSVLFRDVGGTPPVLRFVTRATALATTQGDTGFTSYYLVLDGVIVVNAAGNLDVQFAQAVSNATTSSVFANCSWQVTEKQ